jgi:hypothetical protein
VLLASSLMQRTTIRACPVTIRTSQPQIIAQYRRGRDGKHVLGVLTKSSAQAFAEAWAGGMMGALPL